MRPAFTAVCAGGYMACSHCGRCRSEFKRSVSVSEALAQKRPWVLSALARTCGLSERDAAQGLPEEMRSFAPGWAFEDVWKDICQWDRAVFISQQGPFGLKYTGRIPEGKTVRGIYHFAGEGAMSGHVQLDSISGICFLSLPFMGRECHSIQFFDGDGSVMFAVHVGKIDGRLSPSARASFLAMREKPYRRPVFEIPMYKAG